MAVVVSTAGAFEILTEDPVPITYISGQMPLLPFDDMELPGSYERKDSAARTSRSLTAVSSVSSVADDISSFCSSSKWTLGRLGRPDFTAILDGSNKIMYATPCIKKWETLNDLREKLAWLDESYQCHPCDSDNNISREAYCLGVVSQSDGLDRTNATSSSSSLTVVSRLSFEDVSFTLADDASSLSSNSTWTVSSLDESEYDLDCLSTATSVWSLHDSHEPVLQTAEEEGCPPCIHEESKARKVVAKVCRAVRNMVMKIRRRKITPIQISCSCVRSPVID